MTSDMHQPPEYPPHPPLSPQLAGGVMDQGTERLLAGVAHGAIAFGLFGLTLPISLLITGIIWLYSKRSPYVRYHADQAGCYQCSVLLINVVAVIILGLYGGFAVFRAVRGETAWGDLGPVLWGIAAFALWFVITLILGVIGAILVLLGRPFKYPLIGDWFLKRET